MTMSPEHPRTDDLAPQGSLSERVVRGTSTRVREHMKSENLRALFPLVVAMVVVCVYATLQSEFFLTGQNFSNIFQDIAVLGVLAVGATLLMIGGQMDLSVGSGVSFGSVIAAKMLEDGMGEGLVLLIVVATLAGVGGFWGVLVSTTRVQPFILTLGGLSVLSALALLVSDTKPVPAGLHYADLSLGELGPIPTPAVIFVGLCIVGALLLRYTALGRNTYAIGSNEEAAYLAGVPVGATKIVIFTLSGVLVGVAAIMMVARLGSGDPQAGAGLELQAITAVVLGGATLTGGRGSMLGTFLGVFLLGLIANALAIAGLQSAYKVLILGFVLILAVVWAALGDLARGSDVPLHRQVVRALIRRRGG